MTEPRAQTIIYVTPIQGVVRRWRVRVIYPGTKPTSLVSCPTRNEALKAAHSYAARYGWQLAGDDQR